MVADGGVVAVEIVGGETVEIVEVGVIRGECVGDGGE